MEDEGRLAVSSDFGNLLRRLRLAAGLSQEALAESAQMSINGIGALERGSRRKPQRKTVELLARSLMLSDGQRREFEAAARLGSPRLGAPRRFRASGVVSQRQDLTKTNLPFALSSFVGRELDVAHVKELLERRLVTIVGSEASARRVLRSRWAQICSISILMASGSSTSPRSAIPSSSQASSRRS